MEKNGVARLCSLGLYVCFAAVSLMRCQSDAAKTIHTGNLYGYSNTEPSKEFHFSEKFDTYMPLDSSNFDPYNSPFDSLDPESLLENAHPDCVYSPITPSPPSTVPSPTGYTPSFPPASPGPIFPGPFPFTPSNPHPPAMNPSPPSPPSGFVPSPLILPPTGYSPSPTTKQWCVVKPSASQQTIQPALDYACGFGADCGKIQSSGVCYQPDTLSAHASYAFNSYWKKNKAKGGTCDFGGAATLVSVDPSHDGCRFD